MENHPIPQDVTGFQFKLIGNMTVKQFAYLAIGIVLAWFFLQLPISIFIKFPISAFFAILGISLTFFPISGRPMDTMIGNYIKALIRPTQFLYDKTGGQLYYPTAKVSFSAPSFPFAQKDKLKDYLASQNLPKNKIDEKENNFLMSVSNLASSAPTPRLNPAPAQPTPPQPQPSQQPIVNVLSSILPLQPKPQVNQTIIKPLQGQFKSALNPPAPDSPNLITGITKDARGNALTNILVEVKDKEGSPVRAFKTNEFGRFASATPLINGTYTIEFEDPKGQNTFQKGTVNAEGQIIAPIVAISIDQREELRRSLFSPDASGLNN